MNKHNLSDTIIFLNAPHKDTFKRISNDDTLIKSFDYKCLANYIKLFYNKENYDNFVNIFKKIIKYYELPVSDFIELSSNNPLLIPIFHECGVDVIMLILNSKYDIEINKLVCHIENNIINYKNILTVDHLHAYYSNQKNYSLKIKYFFEIHVCEKCINYIMASYQDKSIIKLVEMFIEKGKIFDYSLLSGKYINEFYTNLKNNKYIIDKSLFACIAKSNKIRYAIDENSLFNYKMDYDDLFLLEKNNYYLEIDELANVMDKIDYNFVYTFCHKYEIWELNDNVNYDIKIMEKLYESHTRIGYNNVIYLIKEKKIYPNHNCFVSLCNSNNHDYLKLVVKYVKLTKEDILLYIAHCNTMDYNIMKTYLENGYGKNFEINRIESQFEQLCSTNAFLKVKKLANINNLTYRCLYNACKRKNTNIINFLLEQNLIPDLKCLIAYLINNKCEEYVILFSNTDTNKMTPNIFFSRKNYLYNKIQEKNLKLEIKNNIEKAIIKIEIKKIKFDNTKNIKLDDEYKKLFSFKKNIVSVTELRQAIIKYSIKSNIYKGQNIVLDDKLKILLKVNDNIHLENLDFCINIL